jgi:hypothetical protein
MSGQQWKGRSVVLFGILLSELTLAVPSQLISNLDLNIHAVLSKGRATVSSKDPRTFAIIGTYR